MTDNLNELGGAWVTIPRREIWGRYPIATFGPLQAICSNRLLAGASEFALHSTEALHQIGQGPELRDAEWQALPLQRVEELTDADRGAEGESLISHSRADAPPVQGDQMADKLIRVLGDHVERLEDFRGEVRLKVTMTSHLPQIAAASMCRSAGSGSCRESTIGR